MRSLQISATPFGVDASDAEQAVKRTLPLKELDSSNLHFLPARVWALLVGALSRPLEARGVFPSPIQANWLLLGQGLSGSRPHAYARREQTLTCLVPLPTPATGRLGARGISKAVYRMKHALWRGQRPEQRIPL